MIVNQTRVIYPKNSSDLSPSHKEFSVSKPKNVSKSINRQMENTKTNENSFSIYSSQSTNLSSLSSQNRQRLVPHI